MADLNRKLMPSFIVHVGKNKMIRMPKLDLERVLGPFEPVPYKGNLKTANNNDTLQTDTILGTHKDNFLDDPLKEAYPS